MTNQEHRRRRRLLPLPARRGASVRQDVAPTFLSAGWEAFQPPVARQECLAPCRLENRCYELSRNYSVGVGSAPASGASNRRPRRFAVWRQQSLNCWIFSRGRSGRQGVCHCTRGGCAPHSYCVDTAKRALNTYFGHCRAPKMRFMDRESTTTKYGILQPFQ